MQRLLTLFLGAGLFAFHTSMAAAQALVVGMGLNKPPYVMEAGEAGLEVEIAEQALAAVGLKMRALQLPPSRGLLAFRAGQLDILLTVDEGVGSIGFLSEPYVTNYNVAISLAANQLQIRKMEDLADYSVAAFQNASMLLGDRFRSVIAAHKRYSEHPQQVTQNNLLYAERVDVIVGDRRILHYLLQDMDPKLDRRKPITVHSIFPPSPRKAVFKDAALRDQFNAGLKIIQGNGTYDAILKKYANLP
jgi:polar amino acid transport system substrate-binding protein